MLAKAEGRLSSTIFAKGEPGPTALAGEGRRDPAMLVREGRPSPAILAKRRKETKAKTCPELEIFLSDPPQTENNHQYAKEVWSCLTGKGQLLRRCRPPIGRKRLNILIHDPPGDPGKVFLEMGIPRIGLLERMFSLACQGFEDGRTAVESMLWGEQHSELD
jgi:hypothetical protein